VGRTIGIHAALKWDDNWYEAAHFYLCQSMIDETKEFLHVGGGVICTVHVNGHRELTTNDSHKAKIECHKTKRFGLILADPKIIEVVPMKGRQGIWFADIHDCVGAIPPGFPGSFENPD
jgi:hypothetical protein